MEGVVVAKVDQRWLHLQDSFIEVLTRDLHCDAVVV
jgi:hypothetical protein